LLAHLHHIRDVYRKSRLLGKRESFLRDAIMKTCFQFLYTTVFGWLCAFIFLRTGHAIAPIICHSFCNIMGFPAFDRISEHSKWEWCPCFRFFFISWSFSQTPSRLPPSLTK